MLDRRFLDVSLVVAGVANEPAVNPTIGTQYIVGDDPTGDFKGAGTGQLARYDGSKWKFTTMKLGGLEVINAETGELMKFDGLAWSTAATLGGDDASGGILVVDDLAINIDDTPAYDPPAHILGSIYVNPSTQIIYYEDNQFRSFDEEVNEGKFASKTDGKVYEYVDRGNLSSRDLKDKEFIFNKGDNKFYLYHAPYQPYGAPRVDGYFEKRTRNPVYIVDGIVDYIAVSDDMTPTEGQTCLHFFGTSILEYHDNKWVANADTSLVDIGKIYAVRKEGYEKTSRIFERSDTWQYRKVGGWHYHDIGTGDYFFNKADGKLYLYNGTDFVVAFSTSEGSNDSTVSSSDCKLLTPVLDIVQTGTELPDTATSGDKFLGTDDAILYKADSHGIWSSEDPTSNGDRYVSLTDFKVYTSNGVTVTASDIPEGGMFLNKTDRYVYVFDGEKFEAINKVAESSAESSAEFICETHTLTAEEATAKSFNLVNAIKSGKETDVFLSVCGVVQIAGTDYTASGSTISWSGKSLEDVGLQAGDVFLVQYIKS